MPDDRFRGIFLFPSAPILNLSDSGCWTVLITMRFRNSRFLKRNRFHFTPETHCQWLRCGRVKLRFGDSGATIGRHGLLERIIERVSSLKV